MLLLTSDMQGLVWGEPELAHEYHFDVESVEVLSTYSVHLFDLRLSTLV